MKQPSEDLKRIVAAVDEAQDAFWAVVVEHFPEATTGDFDMVCDGKMQEWITRWVHLNADFDEDQKTVEILLHTIEYGYNGVVDFEMPLSDQEHVAYMISQGFREGELNFMHEETSRTIHGYWNIKFK